MKNDDSAHVDNDDGNEKKSAFMFAFGGGLTRELDAIEYPDGSQRSPSLATALSLGRAQAYRILKGASLPSVEGLAVLRQMGCSIDRILDQISDTPLKTLQLKDANASVPFTFRSSSSDDAHAFLISDEMGTHRLFLTKPGEAQPENSIPVDALSFPVLPYIAIIDDDVQTLELLCGQFASNFHSVLFKDGKSLLNEKARLKSYSAFIVDWILPDIKGEDLIKQIRSLTNAQIYILTGNTSSSHSIAKALDYPNVDHITKPADQIILIKKINHAIAQQT